MESIQGSSDSTTAPQTESRNIRLIVGQFNWRMILIRVLVNALTLIIISLLLPDIYFADRRLLNVLFLGAMLGVLNAFVKPVIQFLTLPFIFATYGFVVIVINAIVLLLLAALFPGRFVVNSLIWAIVGGAFMGLFAGVLESLFGLNLPITDKRGAAGDQEGPPVARPNPVESLLLEGLAGHEEEMITAPEEAAAPSAAVEPAAEQEAEVASGEALPEAGMTAEEAGVEDSKTLPGDEQ